MGRGFLVSVFFFLYVLTSASYAQCHLSLAELVQLEQAAQAKYSADQIRIAAIIVAVKNGKVLMAHRIGEGANEVGKWGFAGGSMEAKDVNLLAALQREFFEETGIYVEQSRFKKITRMDYEGKDDGRFYASYFYYIELEEDENPRLSEEEALRLGELDFFDPHSPPKEMFSTNQPIIEFLKALLGKDISSENLEEHWDRSHFIQ